jgi:tyrosine-protein kinase Etk/Wzc
MPENQEIGENGQLRYVNVLDYLVVIARYKKLIVRFVGASILLAVVLLYLVLPRWYKSTAVVMPPKQKNLTGLMSGFSRTTSQLRSFGLFGGSDDLQQFQTILKSRRALIALIERFDLQRVYDIENVDDAITALAENIELKLGKEDVSLEVSVYDTDPQRAADMTNYLVQTLNTIYAELSTAEARSNREFLERRYQQNLRDLTEAENNFKAFQVKYGAFAVPEQVKAAVEAAAKLQAEIVLKEIEVGLLQRTTSPDNPLYKNALMEVEELKKQMEKMNTGKGFEKNEAQVFTPLQKAPEVGIQYLRYYREVELQGKLLELILPLYEQARIEEQRDTPNVVVLDTAVPAPRPAKPRRLLITAIVAVGSFLLSVLLAFAVDALRRSADQARGEDREKLRYLRSQLNIKELLR